MSDLNKDELNYADGYIPNNPEEYKENVNTSKKSKKKKSSGAGLFMTLILAFFIIAVGILVNVIFQLKAQQELQKDQIDTVQKKLDAYKKVLSEIDYTEIYEDENEEKEDITQNLFVENGTKTETTNEVSE